MCQRSNPRSRHFLPRRATGNFLPCAALWFVPRSSPWRDDIVSGVDPFDHYLSVVLEPEREHLPGLDLVRASGLIDATYFQINLVGPFEQELDPALHYCRFGWWHAARPNTAFDPEWYAETNPALAHFRINPLLHYMLEGEQANRRPSPWFDPDDTVPATRCPTAKERWRTIHGIGWIARLAQSAVRPRMVPERHGGSIPADVDPFAHYLLSGAVADIDPSPSFDARGWRDRHMSPLGSVGQCDLPVASRNPLVHHFRTVLTAN